MKKGKFKQIDLLRKRRDSLIEPYFIDNRKYIKKGIFSGSILIIITLILGIPFIFRTTFLESKKAKIKIFSDEYDFLDKKLNKESKELKELSKFNSDLKNAIMNIGSSSALFKEIALIIPKNIQLIGFSSKANNLNLKAKIKNVTQVGEYSEYLEALNSFLINLDNSELVKFNNIDFREIKLSEKNSSKGSSLKAIDSTYLVNIETKLSNNFSNLNQKYLIKLGAYGLLNRLNSLESIEESLDID